MFKNKKGFTIVELVIVIAVIAILAAVLIPTFSSVIDKANLSSAQQKARNALTVVIAEEISSEGIDPVEYGFLVDSKYWFTCTVSDGQASELSEGTKATAAPSGYTAAGDKIADNADIKKLDVGVFTKAAAEEDDDA